MFWSASTVYAKNDRVVFPQNIQTLKKFKVFFSGRTSSIVSSYRRSVPYDSRHLVA